MFILLSKRDVYSIQYTVNTSSIDFSHRIYMMIQKSNIYIYVCRSSSTKPAYKPLETNIVIPSWLVEKMLVLFHSLEGVKRSPLNWNKVEIQLTNHDWICIKRRLHHHAEKEISLQTIAGFCHQAYHQYLHHGIGSTNLYPHTHLRNRPLWKWLPQENPGTPFRPHQAPSSMPRCGWVVVLVCDPNPHYSITSVWVQQTLFSKHISERIAKQISLKLQRLYLCSTVL